MRLLALIMLTLAWTVALPGATAVADGVFLATDVREKIGSPEVRSTLDSTDTERARFVALRTAVISRVEERVKAGDFAGGRDAMALRASLDSALVTLSRSRYRVSGFSDNETTLYWKMLYLGLGALVLLVGYRPERWWRHCDFLASACLTYVLVAGPSWYRNTKPGQAGRTVFSYVNADISIPGFLLQDARTLGPAMLLSAIWFGAWQSNADTRRDGAALAAAAPLIRGLAQLPEWAQRGSLSGSETPSSSPRHSSPGRGYDGGRVTQRRATGRPSG